MQDEPFMSVNINHYKTLIKNYFDRAAKEIDITMAHAPYIMVLHKKGRLTQSELTQVIGFDKSNSSRVIADLQSRDIILILKDEKNYIMLTDKGKEIADKIVTLRSDWEKRAYKGISPGDVEIYHRVNKKIRDNIKGMIEEK